MKSKTAKRFLTAMLTLTLVVTMLPMTGGTGFADSSPSKLAGESNSLTANKVRKEHIAAQAKDPSAQQRQKKKKKRIRNQ
jgi:hypothetical protein